MTGTWRAVLLALVLAVAPAGAVAQQASGGVNAAVPWSALSPAQQRLLGQLHARWSRLPPARQRALARGSRRWLRMTPAQRHQAQKRFKQWRRMSPKQRALLRHRWRRFQALPARERAAIRRSFHAFQRLPARRRRALRERWRSATPTERQRMIEQMRQRMMRRQMTRQIQRQPRPVRSVPRFGMRRFDARPRGVGGLQGPGGMGALAHGMPRGGPPRP